MIDWNKVVTAEDKLEQRKQAQRTLRDRLLSQCDWVVTKAQESGEEVPKEWREYRQALRDITEQPGFPDNIDWPAAPGHITT